MRMRDYILMFQSDELVPKGYIYLDFQSDKDSHKSIFGFVFTFGGTTLNWKSVKQSCIIDSTIEMNML